MKALLLAALLPLSACAKPVPLSGAAAGSSKIDSAPKPSKVVSLSGNATASGGAR